VSLPAVLVRVSVAVPKLSEWRRSGRYLPGERGWVKTKNRSYWRWEVFTAVVSATKIAVEAQRPEEQQAVRRSGERVAFNDDLFRKANERIDTWAEEVAPAEFESLPFICECADETCTEVMKVPREEYERVRSDPRLFINVPGHEAAAHGWAAIVERHDGYVVVEKLGRAGEIVEMLDSEPDGSGP
jgi:hypothetical protein